MRLEHPIWVLSHEPLRIAILTMKLLEVRKNIEAATMKKILVVVEVIFGGGEMGRIGQS